MAQINKPTDYFNTVLYTGNSSTQSITGVGFQPDFVWIKDRIGATSVYSHHLFDVIRGSTKYLLSNANDAEATDVNTLTSFDSDGFSLGSDASTNAGGDATVDWNWFAGGTASSNTDGSITSSVSASTTSGFSIVSYTGTGANATVGHGLGVAPKVLLIKERDNAQEWHNGFDAIGWDKYMHFNTDAQATSALPFQSTAPTSTVFSLGASNGTNRSGGGMIAYCFAEKKGFSKFGSYTGNNSSDGVFLYLGFKPSLFIVKKYSASGTDWLMYDNKRNEYNQLTKTLESNTSDAETTTSSRDVDFCSNGIKLRGASAAVNDTGSFIYLAFAESPLVGTNNIPAVAR